MIPAVKETEAEGSGSLNFKPVKILSKNKTKRELSTTAVAQW